MNKNGGFSLIELIIVIAIMAVLVAIVTPNLIQYIDKGKRSADIKNLDEVKHQVTSCIANASINNIDIIALEDGVKNAEYLISYNSSQDESIIVAKQNGTLEFAEMLKDLFCEEKIESKADKKYNKVLIVISGIKSAGYSVEVKYVS
ncbi:MAG: type II secretion system protein [Lachnospiraceae bacterium]|jgi:prepilin-type N-terminal cleavage/methylation domain-containing protein|nr:type II secretion system protein [Lachnospiraceae bacterium]